MTPPHRIAEIQARLDAATPGPWAVGAEDNGWIVRRGGDMSYWGIRVATAYHYATDEDSDARPNAEFIAHTPEDIRYLLERIAALDPALRELVAAFDARMHGGAQAQERLESALADARAVLAGLPHGQEQPE